MTLHPSRSRLRSLTLATAALALGLGLLAGCGDDAGTDPVAADPEPSAPADTDDGSPTPSATAEPSEPGEPTGDSSDPMAAPIYFVGDSPTGPRLYREFREVPADNALAEGAALLMAGDALDPDYDTLLPALDIVSIEATDGAIVVALGADSPTADKATSPAEARIAVQSLVYTLQGIAQTRDPVQVVKAGQPVQLLDQPTDTGVSAADQLAVLSLVNVTSPASDAPVSGTFTASGVASSFEATVDWEIRDDSDTVVLDGFATAEGFMDRLYPWETEVDVSGLAPGAYTFVARTADPSDGEGPGPYEDTKAIVVS